MSTLRRSSWIIASVLLSFLLLVAAALLYVYQQIPTLGGRGIAPVLGAPPQQRTPLPAYSGVHPRVSGRPEEVFKFPIAIGEMGPVDALFAGPAQYPFLCGDDRSRDSLQGEREQPLVDNQLGLGVPIYELDNSGHKSEEIAGYSKDCLRLTRASYYYNRVDTEYFYPLDQADNDIATIDIDGVERDFIVRFETGTINRFIYALAVLAQPSDDLTKPSSELWNGKLIYQLRGGVGIGRRQGNLKPKDVMKRRWEQLSEGYAIVYSTANQTSNHYNIWLAEDTALRVKRQFTALYGEPLYTLGIGGSGGAIQQYLFGQNNPGLIDGAVALYSYPDMASQTIYVMDCEPLEHYFERLALDTDEWANWSRRATVEGLSSTEKGDNYYQWATAAADFFNGRETRILSGGTECIRGWRGLTQLVHNPSFIHFPYSFAKDVYDQAHWTHWEDVKHIYGVGEDGYANSTWDNRGVQYGLEALKRSELDVEDFLHINATVGGWRSPNDMRPERLWFLAKDWFSADFSAWSEQNHYSAQAPGAQGIARRSTGSADAVAGAFNSGLVFSGYIDIPIIDLRHYLDDELDMHHSLASFSSRVRMQKAMGHADNQVIWMTRKPHMPIRESLQALELWLDAVSSHPSKSVLAAKPDSVKDMCFDGQGNVLASGESVWDGAWNGRAQGLCMQRYPSYKTSREIAGGSVAGDVFQCRRQSVAQALARGVYGEVDMSSSVERLMAIFPDGVCDYDQPGIGEPDEQWRLGLLATVERRGTALAVGSSDELDGGSAASAITALAELEGERLLEPAGSRVSGEGEY